MTRLVSQDSSRPKFKNFRHSDLYSAHIKREIARGLPLSIVSQSHGNSNSKQFQTIPILANSKQFHRFYARRARLVVGMRTDKRKEKKGIIIK